MCSFLTIVSVGYLLQEISFW